MSTEVCESGNKSAQDEKAERLFQSAESAISRNEFAAAVSILEEIPDNLRSDEVKNLYASACRLRHKQKHFDAAQRQFDSRQYEFAVRSIGQIPDADRDEECLKLEQTARIHIRLEPIIESAKAKLQINDFDEAVRILEGVPNEIRTREVLELLKEANTSVDQLAEIWAKVDAKTKAAEKDRTWDKYAEILVLLDEVDVIRPRDAQAAARRKEIEPFEERFRQRDLLMEKARRCFENRDYDTADECLQQIPEDDRGDGFTDLSIQNEKRRIVVSQLYDDIAEAFRNGEFAAQIELWKQLDEAQYHPVEQLISRLTAEEFDKCLNNLVAQDAGEPTNVELLDRYLGTVSSVWVLDFIGRCDEGFVANYPRESLVLGEKLREVLRRLPEDPKRLRDRLERLQTASGLLGDDAERVAEWDLLLSAADRFHELHDVEWTRMEQWYEGPKSNELDSAARELAETAKRALPGETDLWDVLASITGHDYNRGDKAFQRAYAKIRGFETAEEWPSASLVPLTAKRILMSAAGAVGLVVLGLAANVVLSLLFNVGGMVGFGMVFFLAVLWTFFCFAANKVL